MTHVVVNLASVAGSADPGDRIRFRAPRPRAARDGSSVITNSWEEFPAATEITVELEPGITEYQIVNSWPSKPATILVPESGVHSLHELVETSDMYDASGREFFLRQINDARNRSEVAASNAASSESAAGLSASEAKGFRDEAASSQAAAGVSAQEAAASAAGLSEARSSAEASAASASESASSASQSASEAFDSASRAGASAEAAAASEEASAGSESTAVDAASRAGDSADSAARSAESASGSAESAAADSGRAAVSQSEAQEAALTALDAESGASESRAAAAASQEAASASEVAAASSASEAASSASKASEGADTATQQASAAARYAETAGSEAGRATSEADRAFESAERATTVAFGDIPEASEDARGLVKLSGDLGGSADAPTVPGLSDKLDSSEAVADVSPGVVVRRGGSGEVSVPREPSAATDAVSRGYVDGLVAGKADLVEGRVPSSQIPGVALTKPQVVSDRAGMLGLTAEEGDVAVITEGDDKGTYMLGDGDPSVFESWVRLASPDSAVSSVNGQTGDVNLSASNVGAAPSFHEHQARDVWDASGETVQSVLDSHELKVREIDGLKSGKLDKSEVSPANYGGMVVRRQADGHITSTDYYFSLQMLLDTLESQPTALASLWAAQQLSKEAIEAEVSQDNTPGKVVRRQDDGHIISANYSSGQQVFDTLKSQPKALASLWAAQQVANDAVDKKFKADVSSTLTNGSIPRRTASGTINAADPQYSAEVATKSYVDARTPKIERVGSLPSSPDPSTIYLVTG